MPKAYPEQRMFGYSLPAHEFYLRHAKNIMFTHVDFQLRNPDQRPAYALEDVSAILIQPKNNPPFWVKKTTEKVVYPTQ